ncbi:MAG: RNA-binding protein [Nanoarchaeota archaeon]
MKIYVGNLPFSISEDALKELFSSYGDVEEASIIKDKFSGRSKGFGFVTISNDEAAAKAVSELDGKEVEGRALKVSEAKPMDPDKKPVRRSFGGGSSGGSRRFGSRERRF